MKKLLLMAVAIMALHVPALAMSEHETLSIQIPGMRFYSVKAITRLPDGQMQLVAAGEIHLNRNTEALIIAFSVNNGAYQEIARDVFRLGPQSNTAKTKTRIRSLIHIKSTPANPSLIVVSGTAGIENQQVGFIRSYAFDTAFKLIDSLEFSDPDTSYTHGYPLIQADINADKKNEIVYGGFSGKNDRDHADIRIFSIGEDGRLAPLAGFQADRLDALRLRVNALASGDLNADGRAEVVVAGRTVENDMEHAAFAIFSDETLIWKQLNDLGTCRYRYATITDMTGDGRPELVLGGRIDQAGTSYALLDVWQAHNKDVRLISRYRFTGAGSTRLRVMEPLPGVPGRLVIGGRLQTLNNDAVQWKGFLQQMMYQSGTLFPYSKPFVLEKDWETRVRTIDVFENTLIVGGFTEDPAKVSAAFISIYPLK
jgi:hypothetical protein